MNQSAFEASDLPDEVSPRGRVLAAVDDMAAEGKDATADEIADRLGLHPTTARFHLRRLVNDRRIVEDLEPAQGRGRPRKVYRPAPPKPIETLAIALASVLGNDPTEREARAIAAGRIWARDAAQQLANATDPLEQATGVLTALGFEVQAAATFFGTHEIRVCCCPLKALGAGYPEVARGLQRGAVEQALNPDHAIDATATSMCSTSPRAAPYSVTAVADPRYGDCEVTIQVTPATIHDTAAPES